ncbi:HdeD family acid-resistance protein [Demequina salsinemoris]|uniref:HdeD family acid-resistance protein n=1 Tax=Demequina salsinemoris TaxID=577470 RepID=UPI000785E2D7|nr:DUF308 domain-containing protein [Demequina salsinemoris]
MTAGDQWEDSPAGGTSRNGIGYVAIVTPLDEATPPPQLVSSMSWVIGFVSAVSLAIGLSLAIWPSSTIKVGAALLAINFLLSGVVRLVIGAMRTGYSSSMRAVMLIFGMLLVIGGVVILRNLAASATLLLLVSVIMVGLSWIVEGVMALVDSDDAKSRVWGLVGGAVSIIAGIIVLAVPGWTATVFLWFAAGALILIGIVGLLRAFAMRRSLKAARA